ncbi:MAG TPA: NAD-dependent deacylase [Candidatus Hydrogenedentes bacterium]|nr:NAD-dependent deacylase [Candidatus Hydrogenedentota bacterium]HIJ73900.1 NAD-dependent deacylase [Candidatus Hydrogenedentota bacterium]
MIDPYAQAADAIEKAGLVIALTGAGISVESGIPDFRGPDGIWVKHPPERYASISAYLEDPDRVWQFWVKLARMCRNCKPNAAHGALAVLEHAGLLHAVITQNVDNLHQDAGSRRIIEYHGNARWLVCLKCGARDPFDLERPPERAPHCQCGGLKKPDVVMFGETIPADALLEAEVLAVQCDVALVIGTSAQIYPAAEIPLTAKRHGAFVVEANIQRTDLTPAVTDTFLEGPAATTVPKLAAMLTP